MFSIYITEQDNRAKSRILIANIKRRLAFKEVNRAKQLNPNNPESGPGHEAGYKGDGTQKDKDNHANQLNPNHPEYKGKQ